MSAPVARETRTTRRSTQMKRLIYVFCVIVAANVAGLGQIRSRFPRPRPNQPAPAPAPAPATATNADTGPAAGQPASTSQMNRAGLVDDAFTWFEAVSTEALGHNNIPYSTGWVLK